MGRARCCDKANVKRGPWSTVEDGTLKSYVETHGIWGNWIALPRKAGLRRDGKSCRLRWLNYLRPDIKRGGFTEEEDNIICILYGQTGSRWSAIAFQLPGRTDNDVKNYWNTKLKKKLIAGKVSLKRMTDNDALPSTQLLTQNADTQISYFPASQNQTFSLSPLPILSTDDASFGFNVNEKSMNFDIIHHLHSRRVINAVSEISANSMNNPMVSLSLEGSSISDSFSIVVDNMRVSPPENAGNGAPDVLMDFGFGFPNELLNGLCCHESVGKFAPCCYPELVDFS